VSLCLIYGWWFMVWVVRLWGLPKGGSHGRSQTPIYVSTHQVQGIGVFMQNKDSKNLLEHFELFDAKMLKPS